MKVQLKAPVVVIAIAAAATAWGLSVSVVMSDPAVVRRAYPSAPSRTITGRARAVVRAPWGSGPNEVGLTTDGEARGPMSFGVDDRERIWVLDQENDRLLCFDDGVVVVTAKLPAGEFDDLAVERDRVCVLSRSGNRRVVVFDGDGRELGQIPIADDVPPILHVLVEGSTVLVECPTSESRQNHAVGTLAPLRPIAQREYFTRNGVALRGNTRASAALASARDITVDIKAGGISRSRLRLHSDLEVTSILDVAGDARGGLYVTAVLTSETAPPDTGATTLSVAHYSATGEPLGWAATPYEPLTDALRRVIVTPAGHVYRMDTVEDGLRIVRWTLTPSAEGASR